MKKEIRSVAEYDFEISKDINEINRSKIKFIKEVIDDGLGTKMKNIKTYIKPEPSKIKIFFRRLKKVLWNV